MLMLIWKILLVILFESTDVFSVALTICYIIGIRKMMMKSGLDGRWAFVPCMREYMLARCADRERVGRTVCGLAAASIVIDVISMAAGKSWTAGGNANVRLFFSLLETVVLVTRALLEIRIFSGLVDVYGVRRRWMLPWFFLAGPTALLWGYSPKFQPQVQAADLDREFESIVSGVRAVEMDKGLTVNLESRTVREFIHKKCLLRDVHMYIKPGRMVLLLGGSGAGKTTLISAINGYEKAHAKVNLNGSDVYAQYRKMLYEVGFVPQQELMRGKYTVYHTLMDAALLRLPNDLNGSDLRKRVGDVMEMFGLTSLRNSLVEKLSGGQKKRLSIAMEYISNPALFILDEPDSGLDGVMARELMQKLRLIADQGRIIIVITHTPDRVIDLFDDVIVLAKDAHRTGRLAFYGTIEEARAFFGKEKMEEIVKAVNRAEDGGEDRADEFIEKFVEVQNAG
ncbi:MAG: ABC transporter ATP-binding protein [Eubacteriales bacterium]|nr:ABC transporter ATP-binding protein [Eubacteriales bacterium]